MSSEGRTAQKFHDGLVHFGVGSVLMTVTVGLTHFLQVPYAYEAGMMAAGIAFLGVAEMGYYSHPRVRRSDS